MKKPMSRLAAAEAMKKERLRRGWSLREAAKRSAIDKGTLQELERGGGGVKRLYRYAYVLGLQITVWK